MRKIVAMFTNFRHWCLSWARTIQSTACQKVFFNSNFTIVPRLSLGIQKGLLFCHTSDRKFVSICNLIHTSHTPSCRMLLDCTMLIGLLFAEEFKLWSQSLCNIYSIVFPTHTLVQTFCLALAVQRERMGKGSTVSWWIVNDFLNGETCMYSIIYDTWSCYVRTCLPAWRVLWLRMRETPYHVEGSW